eukprot:scaffold1271_cov167-Amphora_coffeaeformis.AAC.1
MLVEAKTLADESASSSDEALCAMLGLPSLEGVVMNEEADEPRTLDNLLIMTESEIRRIIEEQQSIRKYKEESVCSVPETLCLDSALMRRITDELSWGKHRSDKTFETIKVLSRGEILERRKITRFENFVSSHNEWTRLCQYIGNVVSVICERPMVLFKEKLNLKPPGGSGFAPHLDAPSLRVALGDEGPSTFVTVMVAIDSMNEQNGCLQFDKGSWSEENAVETIQPESDANPDGNGRAGAIPTELADSLPFEPYICSGGSIALFNGWIPHRSSANRSPFPRRAVFLTYNPLEEGDCHTQYYEHMEKLRSDFKTKTLLARQQNEQAELNALSTIPRI